MIREADISSEPFDRAYEFVRGDLAAGRRPAGSQIRVDETARLLGISPTPVREALAKLAGERLVRRSRRHGYFVPQLDAGELVELYSLAEMHLLAAVAAQLSYSPLAPPDPAQDGPKTGAGIARLFIHVLAGAKNGALLDAGTLIVERLVSGRLVEDPTVAREEEKQIAALLREQSFDALAEALTAYHASRRSAALRIAQAIKQRSQPQDKYFPDMA